MGTLAWLNWNAQRGGVPDTEGWESPLYGDADLSGILELGPYKVMPTMPSPGSGPTIQAVVRGRFHPWPEFVVQASEVPDKTAEKNYHGGQIDDEIAALLYLALGVRLRSGGRTRMWFRETKDPLGTPVEFDHHRPFLPEPMRGGSVLPVLGGQRDMSAAAPLLEHYAHLKSRRAVVALARAARMYAQAVWVADDDPNLAWILLVGAVEAAASNTSGKGVGKVERLQMADPALAELLLNHGGQATLEAVAAARADHMRVQQKFISLMMKHLPSPPDPRAEVWGRIEWSEMESHLHAIYDYRSRALHTGQPFPLPMLEAPRFDNDTGGWQEGPLGLATYAIGSTWNAADTPMILSTFEYIARSVLLSWWESLA